MKTVYVVTSGNYSDYSIRAVFDNKENAELFASKIHYGGNVEEWPLNPVDVDAMRGNKWYHIQFDTNGNVLSIWENSPDLNYNIFSKSNRELNLGDGNIYKGDWYQFALWAKDEEHAKKITFEKFAQFQLGQNY